MQWWCKECCSLARGPRPAVVNRPWLWLNCGSPLLFFLGCPSAPLCQGLSPSNNAPFVIVGDANHDQTLIAQTHIHQKNHRYTTSITTNWMTKKTTKTTKTNRKIICTVRPRYRKIYLLKHSNGYVFFSFGRACHLLVAIPKIIKRTFCVGSQMVTKYRVANFLEMHFCSYLLNWVFRCFWQKIDHNHVHRYYIFILF